jgi:hypothetical protein
MKIHTYFWMKPIPLRQFDWEAVYDNYDGAEDSNDLIGHGATEAEAIADLRREDAVLTADEGTVR